MARKFTEEQIESLRSSGYFRYVGEDVVYYGEEFRRLCWHMYSVEKLMPREIIRRLGLEYDTLGSTRVRGLMYELKKRYGGGGDFSEDRGTTQANRRVTRASKDKMERLQAENEYLKQELKFVKKIAAMDGEGKR